MNKEKLVIIGIGSLTPEVVDFINKYNLYNIIGFSVDKKYIKTEEYMGAPVYPLENLSDFVNPQEVKVFVAISWYNYLNRYKRLKFEFLKSKGYHFANLISPLASVNCSSIGEGNWIMDFAYLGYESIIGDNNTFCAFSLIGHFTQIGNHNVLSGRASIAGNNHIGDQNYFGFCSVVFNKLQIGNKCLIGGGSVVNQDVVSFTVTKAPEPIFKHVKEKHIEQFLSPNSVEIMKGGI